MARLIRGARITPRAIVDAHAEADEIRAAAARDAERELERMKAAATALALEAARAELAASHVEVQRARMLELERIQGDVTELAMGIARSAVLSAFELEPERVRQLVDAALSRVGRANGAVVHVHPDDAALLEGCGAEVSPHPELERGDCVVTSELGDVDARLEVRLSALADALAEAAVRAETEPHA